jgi:hypothetical protein
MLLLAVGYMLYLSGRDTRSSLEAIATVATDLREQGVTGRTLDRDLALQLIAAMDDLVTSPEAIPEHVDDLKIITATAAAWADAAPSPSTELRVAVALRQAAGELRTQALTPSAVHLMRARRHLGAAIDALESGAHGTGGPGPGLATDAVRDRLENLQQSRKERHLEIDEELGN